MKTFSFSLLFFILTTAVSGQEKLPEIDLRVNGVGSGTSYSEVIRKLGKPLRSKTLRISEGCSGSAETYLTLFYSGLEITLLGDGRGRKLDVYSIEVISKKWSASGVRNGETVKKVIAKFGEPRSEDKKSGETVFYYATKNNLGGVSFRFRNNKLVRIEMEEALC